MSSQRPFSVVFPKNKIIGYSHVTHFIRFYWSYNIKVAEISQAACSAKIKPNPSIVIAVFRILCIDVLAGNTYMKCFVSNFIPTVINEMLFQFQF